MDKIQSSNNNSSVYIDTKYVLTMTKDFSVFTHLYPAGDTPSDCIRAGKFYEESTLLKFKNFIKPFQNMYHLFVVLIKYHSSKIRILNLLYQRWLNCAYNMAAYQ